MAQFIPGRKEWSEAFQALGSAGTQAYAHHADQKAIQSAIEGLGENPAARDVLNAVTGAKTYSPKAKQNALKNYMGVAQFEELQKQHTDKKELEELKLDLESKKKIKEAKKDTDDALTLVDSSQLEQEEKDVLREKIKKGEASFEAIQQVLKPNKEAIKEKEKAEDLNRAQIVYNELVDLIPKVGRSGIITSKFGGEDAKSYAKFTSLNGGLESALVDMVSRGTLSNTRFNYIKNELLPQPSDTQAEIEGKLEGLALMIGLDSSGLTGKKEKKESKTEEKTESKRPSLSSFERQ